jgi:hypothetical protein
VRPTTSRVVRASPLGVERNIRFVPESPLSWHDPIVTAGGDGTVKIWEAATGALMRELRTAARGYATSSPRCLPTDNASLQSTTRVTSCTSGGFVSNGTENNAKGFHRRRRSCPFQAYRDRVHLPPDVFGGSDPPSEGLSVGFCPFTKATPPRAASILDR